ncbi:unnamed protein product [Rotaria magnacalcarata]|uniref:non-specific serine/threonine protein kinase n=1 Tax=Rotaria magnacalcarata TaxID=392030 RepID=A0A8S2LDT0_9BILA|nr:unnamed protein product [Rotaria magnacalcarata]
MATSSVSTNIPKKSEKDFKFVKEIGTGSYSTVFFAIEKATDRELAIKAVDKELIKRLKKIPEVFREKEILARLNDCAFAVKLYCTFQNESTLYFGVTYCSNGDLLQYINDAGHFQEDIVRFYSAELVEALEQLHVRNIIHRDLKPENILLTDDMHIQLTDFGSAVIIDNNEVSATDGTDNSNGEKKSVERKNSFVGTAQFVAPEILQRGPVHIGHEYDIFNAVVRVAYKLPDGFPDTIGDLIRKLVRFKPEERLGSEETGGMTKLREHPFFTTDSYETKWGNLLSQKSPLEAKTKLSSRPKDN